MHISNYMTTIILKGHKEKWVMNKLSNRTFAAYAKVMADIKDKPIPKISATDQIYFEHDFKQPCKINSVINIDLKSAYAAILYRDRYISKETYDYLCNCQKRERLAGVGMIAKKSTIYYVENGVAVNSVPVVSPTAGIFFYAVKKTYEIMSLLKKHCGENYLFTWADGIYFLPDDKIVGKCIKELKNHDFDFHVDYLKDFDVQLFRRRFVITFEKKNGHNEFESKMFQLPLNKSNHKKSIIEAFNNFKKSKNETGKGKISYREG